MIRNTPIEYGLVTKVIHGSVMILVIGMLIIGAVMNDIQNKELQGLIYTIHELTGLVVLTLGMIFALWSLNNQKPGYPINMPRWEQGLACIVRFALYFLLIAMPLSGWITSTAAGYAPDFFGYFTIPAPFIPLSKTLADNAAKIHYYLAWSFATSLGLHLLGALKHHFIDKNQILTRML